MVSLRASSGNIPEPALVMFLSWELKDFVLTPIQYFVSFIHKRSVTIYRAKNEKGLEFYLDEAMLIWRVVFEGSSPQLILELS